MDKWVGLSVGEVLEICGASYADARLLDDPPGRLRAVEFECREDGQPKPVVLEIDSGPGLFSEERAWPQTLVEKQKVVAVHSSADRLF